MTAGSVDLIRNDLLWPISTVLYTEHDDKIPGQGPGGGGLDISLGGNVRRDPSYPDPV